MAIDNVYSYEYFLFANTTEFFHKLYTTIYFIMAVKTAAQLKSYFQTGLKPTQAQFEDLIDSTFNSLQTATQLSVAGNYYDAPENGELYMIESVFDGSIIRPNPLNRTHGLKFTNSTKFTWDSAIVFFKTLYATADYCYLYVCIDDSSAVIKLSNTADLSTYDGVIELKDSSLQKSNNVQTSYYVNKGITEGWVVCVASSDTTLDNGIYVMSYDEFSLKSSLFKIVGVVVDPIKRTFAYISAASAFLLKNYGSDATNVSVFIDTASRTFNSGIELKNYLDLQPTLFINKNLPIFYTINFDSDKPITFKVGTVTLRNSKNYVPSIREIEYLFNTPGIYMPLSSLSSIYGNHITYDSRTFQCSATIARNTENGVETYYKELKSGSVMYCNNPSITIPPLFVIFGIY